MTSTFTLGLEFAVLASNIAVLVGVALEYRDVKQETSIEPGHTEFPEVFGTALYGKWIPGRMPSTAKRVAALGWKILTVGLFAEVVLTPCLLASQFRDERRSADYLSQQQRRIERLELKLEQLENRK